MILEAKNPDPKTLPTLGVWQATHGEKMLTHVSSVFPNVPDFTCDSWCYESPMDFEGARALDGGKVELRHRLQDQPHVVYVTTVTPEPEAVVFEARAEVDTARDAGGKLPDNLLGPNLCWQLRRAPGFASKPDPYPEFVKRCFLFTDDGVTFLDRTERRNIPVRPADHQYNNPPWVQMYIPVWEPLRKSGPEAWADYSPDRYIYPVIGTVSRDRKYLTAIVCEAPTALCQAWHDCMHNNPRWLPDNAPSGGRTWRLRVYAMENDPEALLKRVGKDFPQAMKLKEKRVPAGE